MSLPTGRASIVARAKIARSQKNPRPRKFALPCAVATVAILVQVIPSQKDPDSNAVQAPTVSILEPQNGTALERNTVTLRARVENQNETTDVHVYASGARIQLNATNDEITEDIQLSPGTQLIQLFADNYSDLTTVVAPEFAFHFDPNDTPWVCTSEISNLRVNIANQDQKQGTFASAERESTNLDLVFVIDLTVSMNNKLDEVATLIETIAGQFANTESHRYERIRYAAVKFDDTWLFEHNAEVAFPLSESLFDSRQLENVNSGGSTKENHYEAIAVALNHLESNDGGAQSSSRKMIVVLTDAPPKKQLGNPLFNAIVSQSKNLDAPIYPVVFRTIKDQDRKVLEEAKESGNDLANRTNGTCMELGITSIDNPSLAPPSLLSEVQESKTNIANTALNIFQIAQPGSEKWTWQLPDKQLSHLKAGFGKYLHFSTRHCENIQLVIESPNEVASCQIKSEEASNWDAHIVRLNDGVFEFAPNSKDPSKKQESDHVRFRHVLKNSTGLKIQCTVTPDQERIDLDRVILSSIKVKKAK